MTRQTGSASNLGENTGLSEDSGGKDETPDRPTTSLIRFRRPNGLRKGPWSCLVCGAVVEDLLLHAEWHVATRTERSLRPPDPTSAAGTVERTILVDVARHMSYRVGDRVEYRR